MCGRFALNENPRKLAEYFHVSGNTEFSPSWNIAPSSRIQAKLFDDPETQARSASMMSVMDAINRKMGQGSMTIAASGIRHRWAMRRERKTPNYTTDWNELPVAG
jgi:DNA polymerase V